MNNSGAAKPADDQSMIGRTIAHYRIVERLGKGGMGVVYRAVDLRLDRPVALKLLPAEKMSDPQRRRRFIQEAKAASALNHPNIITVYDVGTAEGVGYIAMEYVSGKTLYQLIGRKGLPLNDALKYGAQTAAALATAHAAGIVHRDLKPANIMVTERNLVKVLDFGLAKLLEPLEPEEPAQLAAESTALELPPVTRKGTILGTATYMSPEQAEGKELDPRSDIFSFGTVLYEMITGQRAFDADSTVGTLSAILSKEPVAVSEARPEVPREVERLILRCLRKDRERRPQAMADVALALEELLEESVSGRLPSGVLPAIQPRPQRRWLRFAGAGLLALTLIAGGALWWSRRPVGPTGPQVLTRLTTDSGLSAYPALSPDGKLLAYASDRGGDGKLDLWLRQVAGGESVRLTHHEADDYDPAFSPDGTKIAFRSEREGGGIYLVSALGGEERLIARNGRRPRFSPDGGTIAFWMGATGNSGTLETAYLVPSGGGTPKQWQAEMGTASHPIFSPDGRHILFLGKRDAAASWPDTADWWVAPVSGGPALSTGAYQLLGRQAILNFVAPEAWLAEGNRILFAQKVGDSTNLWQVRISPKTFRLEGSPERLTSGAGIEVHACAAPGGHLVFSSLVEDLNVWSLPIEPNHARIKGEIEKLTQEGVFNLAPSVTPDGKKFVYLSNRSGSFDIWVQDVDTRRDYSLTASQAHKWFPIITADGSRAAFGSVEGGKSMLFVLPSSGGELEKVCDDCGAPRSWSSDGSLLLYQGGRPSRIQQLTLRTGQKQTLLSHPQYGLYSARLSPDDRWIAFQCRIRPDRTRVFVAPFRPGTAAPEQDWIAVTSGESEDDKPRWSPDGTVLYFTSLRDGFRCIWAQRLEPQGKRPSGGAFSLRHFHHSRLTMMNVGLNQFELSVARDKILFVVGERIGNIWMAKTEGQP